MQMGMQRALDGNIEGAGDFSYVGYVFTFIFTVELSLRIPAYRVHFFLGPEWKWDWFDAFIVVSALAEIFLSGVSGLRALRALRVLRWARTLRVIRSVNV